MKILWINVYEEISRKQTQTQPMENDHQVYTHNLWSSPVVRTMKSRKTRRLKYVQHMGRWETVHISFWNTWREEPSGRARGR